MKEAGRSREEVKEIVRQVLESAAPDETGPREYPQHVRVNSLKDNARGEFDRDESAKPLIAEDDLLGLEKGSRVRVAEGVRLTPLASDIVREREIELIAKKPRSASLKVRSVGIGCDHGGFELKQKLSAFLESLGLRVRDFGTDSPEAVDYPDFAHAVALAVSRKQVDVGIIIDGAGIGSAMAANKVPDVKAAACYNEALAKNSREHNGANVLTLGSGQNSFEEAMSIVKAFLTSEISEERHKKRVVKIETIEKQYRNQS